MKPKVNPKKLAEVLFDISCENQCLDEVRASLSLLYNLVIKDGYFRMLVQSKRITSSQKPRILNKVFAEAGHPLVNETISYLSGSEAVSDLKNLSIHFNFLYKKQKNILLIKAVVAKQMGENQIKSFRASIEAVLQMNTELSIDVDPSIVGGFKLRIDNTFLDASIQNKLKILHSELLKI